MPSIEDIRNYIGEAKPIWDELVLYIEKTYKPKRQLDYSKDSLQPGWNVKYRKSGKALCTLYPMEGYFIVLVVVGPKEEEKVRHDMEAGLFSESVKKLYEKSTYSTMGRWLMIEVKDKSVLNDIKRLLCIRIMPKQWETNRKTLNELIKGYTHHVQEGEIQIAYKGIFEFLNRLRTTFIKKYPPYDVSSIYQGYMDMSYFSLSTKSLKDKGLKITIVYLHEKGVFEVMAFCSEQRYWKAVIFTIILIIFRMPITNFFETLFPQNPQFSLATFNLGYNILYTLLLLVFMDKLVDFVTKVIKDKGRQNEKLTYVDEHFLQNPTVAIEQALKEIFDMLLLAKKNLDRSFSSLVTEDTSKSKEIDDDENRIDYLTDTLTSFFIKISSVTKTADTEFLIGGLHHVTNDIERLGDYAMLIFKETKDMKRNEIKFLEQTKEELTEIYERISTLFDLGYEAFTTRTTDNFIEISQLHKEIGTLINTTRDSHVSRLNSGMYPVELSKNIYSVLFLLKRISDHIVNIAFSIRSTTGSEKEALQTLEIETV